MALPGVASDDSWSTPQQGLKVWSSHQVSVLTVVLCDDTLQILRLTCHISEFINGLIYFELMGLCVDL